MNPSPEACDRTRGRFLDALDDPAAEKEVLLHCARCADCMAAFTELRDTVDRLSAAADAVPASDAFATSVLAGIRKEKKRMRRSRIHLALGGSLLIAAAFLLGLALAPGRSAQERTARIEDPAGGIVWSAAEDAGSSGPSPAAPDEAAPSRQGAGADENPATPDPPAPNDREPGRPPRKPAPRPDPKQPNERKGPTAEELLAEYFALEKALHASGHRRKGFLRRRVMHLMERASRAGVEELREVLDALASADREKDRPGRNRFRDHMMARLKDLIDKKMGKERKK